MSPLPPPPSLHPTSPSPTCSDVGDLGPLPSRGLPSRRLPHLPALGNVARTHFSSFCLSLCLSVHRPILPPGPQWMYIIPVVLFLMMSGAPDAGGQGGGGGGGGGGGSGR